MRHRIQVSASVPPWERHFDRATIGKAYLPRLHRAYGNRGIMAKVQSLDGGALGLTVDYEADLRAEQDHHLSWLNATLEAAQQAGLQVAEAYVMRSISMALLGGGAGAASGYKAGGAAGAIVLGAIGLVVGDFFRTYVPIFRAEYSPYFGWQLVPVQQPDIRTFQFGLA